MCGEAAAIIGLDIILCITRASEKGAMSKKRILRGLRLPLYKKPHHRCPYYAGTCRLFFSFLLICFLFFSLGPVLICAVNVDLSNLGPSNPVTEKKSLYTQLGWFGVAVSWLLQQPARMPHWHISRYPELTLCLLQKQEEKGFS